MRPCGAGSGSGSSRAEWGLLGPKQSDLALPTRIGQVEPRGAGSGRVWGRVGPSRAEWGWGGVGHAFVDRPSGAAWGRVGPSRAEQGRLVLSGVGEGLGMHWDSIKLL